MRDSRRTRCGVPSWGVIGSQSSANGHTEVELRPLLVDAKQAARLLGIGRTTLYELIHSETLVPLRIGRCVRFSVASLEQFVAEGCVAQPESRPAPKATTAKQQRRAARPVRSGGAALQLFDPSR